MLSPFQDADPTNFVFVRMRQVPPDSSWRFGLRRAGCQSDPPGSMEMVVVGRLGMGHHEPLLLTAHYQFGTIDSQH